MPFQGESTDYLIHITFTLAVALNVVVSLVRSRLHAAELRRSF